MARMHKINLNLVMHLQALLEERNVSQAAKKSGITQAAMSNALKKLRDLFGDELLIRVGNSMEFTSRGESIRAQLQDRLGSLENLFFDNLSFDPLKEEAEFRLGLHGYEELVLLPAILTFLKDYPKICVRSVGPPSQNLPADLVSGNLQLTTCPFMEANSAGLKRKKILEDSFVCLSGDRNLQSLSLSQYAKANHLLIAPYSDNHSMIDEALRPLQLTRRIHLSVHEFSSAPLILTKEPRLLCTVPSRLAQIWSHYFGLVTLPCPFPPVKFAIAMSWHSRWDNDPRSKWIRGVVFSAAGVVCAMQPLPLFSDNQL